MLEWNNSNLWVKLSKICYSKILIQALPHDSQNLILEFMIVQFVSIVIFALAIIYTYWTLVNARVKEDKHLEDQECYLDPKQHFWFSKYSSFFTRRFLYIFGCWSPWCGTLPYYAAPPYHAARHNAAARHNGVKTEQRVISLPPCLLYTYIPICRTLGQSNQECKEASRWKKMNI